MKKIQGAVQGINNPRIGCVLTGHGAAFLHEKTVVRACLGEFSKKCFLGSPIGFTDEISRSFFRHLEIFNLAKAAHQAAACTFRCRDHNVDKRRAGAGGSIKSHADGALFYGQKLTFGPFHVRPVRGVDYNPRSGLNVGRHHYADPILHHRWLVG